MRETSESERHTAACGCSEEERETSESERQAAGCRSSKGREREWWETPRPRADSSPPLKKKNVNNSKK